MQIQPVNNILNVDDNDDYVMPMTIIDDDDDDSVQGAIFKYKTHHVAKRRSLHAFRLMA